ncbi:MULTISPECIES: MFS transporter [Streptomyces]|uniref:MFS family permease n=1 Tax=Streptomyces stelliscabiei TaxID=146820 RepID=A0A8I0TUJ8_9ACTN|nr:MULTISPECIES: MFS transporter [Streptomyces]MBE1600877.1 MFS family permease [Streptomyces stelliscabiei]MDX2519146.1 MFS transporter [Streptomyces stelliscabiei]MDX2554299.1 MFS transporter [Streptomyces stelliscabiei]MDX2609976.1 MFS transporter [Streptomyces stelliscabiei]MDX2638667.1 MFS transporter [Streptomyces stelliscabiei]
MTTVPSTARAAEPEPDSSHGSPLRGNRDFVLLWIGAAATALGARVSGIAYPLLVIWTTGSASSAGLVGFAALLPNLLVQMHAGALVDRFDRRRLMIFCDLGALLATGAVAAAVLAGHVWIWLLMAAAFVQGSLAIFYRLAERAGVRHLVPSGQLAQALSANEARTQAAGLLGQPGGSVLYALSRSAPFLLATVAHAVSLVSLLLIRKKFQEERTQQPGNITAELREGLGWTWRQRFLRSGMLLISGSNLLFQVLSLALIVIIKEDGGSAGVVGVITAVSGLGGLFGALTGSWWMRRISLRGLLIGGAVGWALLMPLVGLTADPILLGLIFLGAAMIGSVTNVAGGIYQVTVTPDRLQGRVGAAMGLIATGASSLGTVAGGFALESFGSGTTVFAAAAAMGLIALLSFLLPAAPLPEQADREAPADDTTPHPVPDEK